MNIVTTTEIICCLQEILKNTASADCINPKITIINDIKPDSFTWVLQETIKTLEKSIITKSTSADFDDIWDF